MKDIRPIEFYFDFSSPYSYVASEWIEALAARHGRTVSWKAILLGVTFQAAELKSPVEHPIKREYSMLDFERSARHAGVPYTLPPKFPIPAQNAARIFWWLHEKDALSAAGWARHALRGYFTRGVDLSDAASLKLLAAEFGIDPAQAQAAWTDPHWKARLKQACEEAVARGVFGAPFFFIDGEPFWGNDRRAQIERWLDSGPF
ncbi:MAG: 2-hydroxychromene-2-carboxylate isomerase [Pseudomonadota bacterium]|nr:2-hydroxychromene-2-carboxylate isomerase [Pseudomonadota bacterium]